VVEQGGLIKLIKDGGAPNTFLDISSKVTYVGGEQGLLSMAFAPDYATSGKVLRLLHEPHLRCIWRL
jgi:hypothetical protein